MRTVLVLFCLCFALAVHADGMVLGSRHLAHITETDQVAIIDLQRSGVTLDMYIAIDGIPKGEIVTYVLPFWHKPAGFSLEEMDGKTFYAKYTQPVQQHALVEGKLADDTFKNVLGTSLGIGVAGAGPAGVLAACGGLILLPRVLGGSHKISPYDTLSTPVATAELYRVKEQDVPALVEKAGLPTQYADVLKRYRTEYFAVMRLTGMGTHEEMTSPRGVHYHFSHPMAGGDSYTYTYPLGTGGGWAKPIVLTEVYITCTPGWSVQVDAPRYGETDGQKSYMQLMYQVQGRQRGSTVQPETANPFTVSLTSAAQQHPDIWHRAYFTTNPTEDIVVNFARNKYYPVRRFAEWLLGSGVAIGAIALVNLILVWMLAIHIYLRRQWVNAGSPGTFGAQVAPMLRNALIPGFVGGLLMIIAEISSYDYAKSDPLFPWTMALSTFFVLLFITCYCWARKTKQQYVPLETDKYNPQTIAYLIAMGCYLVLSFVVAWLFEQAVLL